MSRYSSKARSSKDKEGLALYEEITSLRDELSANDKIKKRRKALERLCGLLRDATVRNRISSLAVQQARERGHSPAKARSEAMSAFWSLVLDSAFNSTNRLVAGGKNKLTQQDIAQPLSLVPLADEALSGSRVRLESYARLSEKNVKRILKFCFDILDHDEARTLAELEAMNALLFLCERVDYVAYFRPDNEIMSMLATVEASLQGADEVSVAAAKIFSALVQSCYELGIALHGIIDQCLIMVSKWCKRHITAETYGTREFGDLVRGITTLLRFHPEQSIKPLTRYGRILLSYAKRVHVNADSMNRSAIHGYYIAHL